MNHSMKQYQQLGDYKPTAKQYYDQIDPTSQTTQLFIHKLNFPTIVVRAPRAVKKIHCWRFKTLEIVQYADNFGTCEKAVAQIQFDGELIFTLLDMFNQMIGREILEYVENISNQLRKWCAMPIKNIFLVSQKSEQSLGFKHAYLKITPILFHIDQHFYYEHRRWLSVNDEQSIKSIRQIEQAEQVKGSSSYGEIFQNVCEGIKQNRVVRQQMAMKRKRKEHEKDKKEGGKQYKFEDDNNNDNSNNNSNRSASGDNNSQYNYIYNNHNQIKGNIKSFSADYQQSYEMGSQNNNNKY